MLSEAEQEIVTRERLRLLAIGFYVKGGAGALFVSIFLIHFVMLLTFPFTPESSWQTKPPVRAGIESAISPSPTPQPVNQGPPVVMFRVFAGVLGLLFCSAGPLARSRFGPAAVFRNASGAYLST
jgi:hypothetical protein